MILYYYVKIVSLFPCKTLWFSVYIKYTLIHKVLQ